MRKKVRLKVNQKYFELENEEKNDLLKENEYV